VRLPDLEAGQEMMDDADWQRLVAQVRRGDCTPFLGSGACHPTLPTGRALSEEWAERERYPFEDRTNLPRVMQYAAIRARDTVEVKQRLAQQLRLRGRPAEADATEPHRLLALQDLPVYLTTNYDDFMVRALRAAGKRPRVAICPWYRNAPRNHPAFRADRPQEPRHDEPLVYHLHGSLDMPQSLVVTEDDYMEFLVNLAKGDADSDRQLVPLPVIEALNRPLLFIGYSLEDVTFRVIFRGMLRDIAEVQRRRHISVQLRPTTRGNDPDAGERAVQHLRRLLDGWNVSVYWGTAGEFCREFGRRLREAA
jgi:SIR2-like domain